MWWVYDECVATFSKSNGGSFTEAKYCAFRIKMWSDQSISSAILMVWNCKTTEEIGCIKSTPCSSRDWFQCRVQLKQRCSNVTTINEVIHLLL